MAIENVMRVVRVAKTKDHMELFLKETPFLSRPMRIRVKIARDAAESGHKTPVFTYTAVEIR